MSDYNERLDIAVNLALIRIRAVILREIQDATLSGAQMQQVQTSDVSTLVRLRLAPVLFDESVGVGRFGHGVPRNRDVMCEVADVYEPVEEVAVARPSDTEMTNAVEALAESVLEEVVSGVHTPVGRAPSAYSDPGVPPSVERVWRGGGWHGVPLRPCRLFRSYSERNDIIVETDEESDTMSSQSGAEVTEEETPDMSIVLPAITGMSMCECGSINDPIDLTK